VRVRLQFANRVRAATGVRAVWVRFSKFAVWGTKFFIEVYSTDTFVLALLPVSAHRENDPHEIRGATLDWNDSRRNLFRDSEVPPDFLSVARMLEQRLRTALSEAFVLFLNVIPRNPS
jgi:hypothetical protein